MSQSSDARKAGRREAAADAWSQALAATGRVVQVPAERVRPGDALLFEVDGNLGAVLSDEMLARIEATLADLVQSLFGAGVRSALLVGVKLIRVLDAEELRERLTEQERIDEEEPRP